MTQPPPRWPTATGRPDRRLGPAEEAAVNIAGPGVYGSLAIQVGHRVIAPASGDASQTRPWRLTEARPAKPLGQRASRPAL